MGCPLGTIMGKEPGITEADFEAAVGDALDSVPEALLDRMNNVVFFIEEEPSVDEPDLLGVYDGTPLTERGDHDGQLPDRITIFRGPLTRMCSTHDELVHEISVTVIHEIAHHFGIDDERLHALGWG
ncbi:MAG: metallopeptidase family protein [Ornithinimicrobium sp.]